MFNRSARGLFTWLGVCALLVGACAGPSRDSTLTGDAPAAASGHVVGMWLKGIHIPPGWHEWEVIGLFFQTPGTPRKDAGELQALLAEGQIIGTFRSAREAWAIAPQIAAGRELTWIRATAGDGWGFAELEPPRVDELPPGGPKEVDAPLGDPDRSIRRGAQMFVLPPPLRERGVVVALATGKAYSLWYYWPRDLSFSFLTSWEDVEDRMGPLMDPGREMWVWSPDRRWKSVSWEERGSLRESE